MFNIEHGESFGIALHNIAQYRGKEEVEHIDVISPFSRLYLITQGTGRLTIGKEIIKMKAGYLYLVPSYTFCSYQFSTDIVQYYIHFSTSATNGLNIYDFYSHHNSVKSETFDQYMILKLLNLHPDAELPSNDPQVYQSKEWMNHKVQYSSISHYFETKGILELLLSKFLYNEDEGTQQKVLSQTNFKRILIYIQQNLAEDLRIDQLAKMAFYSKDHFTRIFKQVTGYPPIEYIIRKRVEKAQCLLLTSNLSQKEIIERSGFKSLSYFSKIFTKHTGVAPGKFRKDR